MKRILIILMVLGLSALAGCNDFLDKIPDNRTAINSEDKISALLVTAYPSNTYVGLIEARCDGYIDRGSTQAGNQPSSTYDYVSSAFVWGEYATSQGDDSNKSYWSACYAAIAVCNHALLAISKLPDPTKANKQKGEALVARAYSHFCLLSIFSNMFDKANASTNLGIPYVKDVEEVVLRPYDRGTVGSTMEQIYDDLVTGMQLLGAQGDFKQPTYHFNSLSANAFAARVALFMGDYQSVIAYANAVIPSPSLLAPVSLANTGVILTNDFDGTAVTVVQPNDMAQTSLKASLHDWGYYYKAYGNIDALSIAFSSDSRKSNMLISQCFTSLRRMQLGNTNVRHVMDKENLNIVIGPNITQGDYNCVAAYSMDNGETPFTPKFYLDFMYTDVAGGIGYYTSKIPQLRMEETLLARAEAYAMLGQYNNAIYDLQMYASTRIADYNAGIHYISKDGLLIFYAGELSSDDNFINSSFNRDIFTEADPHKLMLQKAIILNVLDFRHVEFLWEGLRYFDILRWNIPVKHTTIDGLSSTLTPDDDRRVLQIPQMTEISGLKKNPYTPKAWQ